MFETNEGPWQEMKFGRVVFLVILYTFQINVTNVRDKQLMEDILVNTIGWCMWMVHAY